MYSAIVRVGARKKRPIWHYNVQNNRNFSILGVIWLQKPVLINGENLFVIFEYGSAGVQFIILFGL